jgi:catalase
MTLDRNPQNFFAETEQVAFHLGNVVPGIDFTNDPLLQARLFSYLDTQLIRLGGPNFPQLPVNRPVAPVTNHHRDGYHQTSIHNSRAAYHKNTLSGGCPAVAGPGAGAGGTNPTFSHYTEQVDGQKIRKRSESFKDHYSQATLFWNSMSDWEREHIVAAFRFELGKVETVSIREGVVEHLNHVDHNLAKLVAEGIGVEVPDGVTTANHGRTSPALSQANAPRESVQGRKIAILVADGVESGDVGGIGDRLVDAGAICEVLAFHDGTVQAANGARVEVTRAMNTMASVLYDAVLVPGGEASARALAADGLAVHFVAEAFKHGKAVGAINEGVDVLIRAGLPGVRYAESGSLSDRGVVTHRGEADHIYAGQLIDAIAQHRHWDRNRDAVPA